MILKFIHDNFELDLASHEFAMVEENSWFSNQLFTKYTYPIEIELTDEQDADFNYISHQNLQNRTSYFEGRFYNQGENHEAVLEVEKILGRVISAQIRYGFEELPNAKKKLSELPLEDLVVTSNIFTYVNARINNVWPSSNFCFAKIFTDKIDKDNIQWAAFEGAINNYKDGAMLINEYDAVNDVQINRNILQPLPFLLHILQKGFQDAGYVLAGDILIDSEFSKAFIYHFSEYYSTINTESIQFSVTTNQYDLLMSPIFARYEKTIILPEPGRYKFAGNVVLRAKKGGNYNNNSKYGLAAALFLFNGSNIWSSNFVTKSRYKEEFKTIEFTIDFYGTEGNVIFKSDNLPFAQIDEVIDYEAMIADISVTQLTKFDTSGNPLPSLIVPNEIKLTKCVPDITFGKLFEICRTWKNFDLVLENGVATMNYLTRYFNTANAISLKDFEVKHPEIYFNQGKSFVFKFQKINTEAFPEYQYPEIYIDINGHVQTPFIKKDNTEEITIEALPLPLKTVGGYISAHDFLDDKNMLFIGMYNGLVSGNNRAMDPSPLMIPSVYINHYQDWFDFLLKTITYNWSFLTHPEKLQTLKVKSVIYAYQNYHLIERISRSNTTPELLYIEIETKTLI